MLFVLLSAAVVAAVGAASPAASTERAVHVVVLDEAPLAVYRGGIDGLAATDPAVTGASRLDPDAAASRAYREFLASRQDAVLAAAGATVGRSLEPLHRYDAVLNGFAVRLSPAEAALVEDVPGVSRVVQEFHRELLTDAGPEWIGAPGVWSGSDTGGVAGTKGEGVVVGVIDTGINHDHPSFAEVGPVDGYVHRNPRGRFYGACDPVLGAPLCNDKLIGAWDFTGTTPEDTNGHGSHTAGTSVGNVLDARLDAPTTRIERRISGVAPHANLITYKACITTCPISAILASINQATLDRVDVINYSIGGASSDPWSDLDAVAFRNARAAGVFVATSAGNSGPGAATMGSPADAPWVTAVGASTHNRDFPNSLVGMTGGGSAAPGDMRGKGVTAGYGPARIVYAGDYGSPLCGEGPAAPDGSSAINPFPPGTFNGEIVVCDRGTYGRVAKGQNVKEGGAGGYVLVNDQASGDSLTGDAHVLPGVHLTYRQGLALKAWLASGTGHTARITGMSVDESPQNGDVMASFSSRGPNPSVRDLIKPDVTAPGVDILAAFNTVNPTAPPEYGVISGTSMSSPHTAGAAALLRALRPQWTPDEVRSALVTTAKYDGVRKEDAATAADPFDMGGGRIDLTRAGRAGLVLDETVANYEAADPAAGGSPAALNLPTLAHGACPGTCTWTRVVRSSAATTVTWTAAAAGSEGLSLAVEPSSFTLAPGATQTVRVTATAADGNAWRFGRVTLTPSVAGVPAAHLTVAVRRGAAGPTADRLTLHFHGNASLDGADHASGHPGEGNCTGDGKTDLLACAGPMLLESGELSPSPAASWKGGPAEWAADGANDRTIYDPSWIWCLRKDNPANTAERQCPAVDRERGPTTLSGPMTVEWWAQCGLTCAAVGTSWDISLWADGVRVVQERVSAGVAGTGVPKLLRATVNVPEVTASHRFTLHVEPVFLLDQAVEFTIYYDSRQPCPGATGGPCDSRVHMPVVVEEPPKLPDLTVADATASNNKARQGQKVTLRATIANGGEADAPASTTRFVLEDGTVIGSVATPAIAAGGSATVAVDWDTRDVSGERTIRITADADGAVAEADEANNVGTLRVTVRGNKVQNSSFEQSSNGSSPDGWTSSGSGATYDGHSVTAGPAAAWSSSAIDVVPGGSYDLVVASEGAAGTVVLQHLSGTGALLSSVSLPVLGSLDQTVSVPADTSQVRIVLQGGLTGTTFHDVALYGD
ncbi:MAG TPA: S8 family serine peptidase [Gaiellaceae bacterium]|nr:S8 family serine peptidase [Gaiellaceae bacterium]